MAAASARVLRSSAARGGGDGAQWAPSRQLEEAEGERTAAGGAAHGRPRGAAPRPAGSNRASGKLRGPGGRREAAGARGAGAGAGAGRAGARREPGWTAGRRGGVGTAVRVPAGAAAGGVGGRGGRGLRLRGPRTTGVRAAPAHRGRRTGARRLLPSWRTYR